MAGGCKVSDPPARDTLEHFAPEQHRKLIDDLSYGPDAQQVLDVVVPATREPNGRAVVWLHNGGWVFGDENDLPPILDALVESDGYTVFAVRYRLSGMAKYPAPVQDADRAVRFLKVHGGDYGIDAGHLVTLGFSSGAHLALLSGLADDEFQAAGLPRELAAVDAKPAGIVALAPPLDLLAFADHDPDGYDLVTELVGCPDLRRCAKVDFAETKPAAYADPHDPMIYIAQGDRDVVVPVKDNLVEIATLESKVGSARVWFDFVDSGPSTGREHAVDQGLNLTALRAFLDAVMGS